MQEKIVKRSREEESPLGNEIFSEGFKVMYSKKAKLISKLRLSKDSEQETIIITATGEILFTITPKAIE